MYTSKMRNTIQLSSVHQAVLGEGAHQQVDVVRVLGEHLEHLQKNRTEKKF